MPTEPTLREQVADRIREAIIRGELKPGARLQEVEVALTYNTSRTPVREAFHQLESEGFLTIRPRRGAYVTALTERDIREFYDIKGLLEGYAAKLAVNFLTEEEISRMEELNDELERRYRAGDISGMVPVHNEFHDTFVSACGNERLVGLLRGLVKQFQRFRIVLSYTSAVEESINLHRRIVQAFRDRDPERAEALVNENALNGGRSLLSILAESGYGLTTELHFPAKQSLRHLLREGKGEGVGFRL